VIQVTNMKDGKSVTVTVDDTGSFRHPNILDLSHAAFTSLAPEEIGVIEVSVARIL
jgi:rare lipoprotein A (peptidoglycan hydrolase)